jgi:hypothetical protein
LPRDADRVPPFLRKTGVINDPGLNRPVALDAGQHHFADLGHDSRIRPGRVGNEVKQRLMLRRHPRRCGHRGHRLDALAFSRHQQPDAVIPQRFGAVRVTDHLHQACNILVKPGLTPVHRREIHLSPPR